jgi:transglutaminase-like putative cysteine protease
MGKQPKTKPPASPALTAKQSLWLFCAALLTLAPLIPYLPPWLSSVSALALFWRAAIWWRQEALPSRWILVLLVIGGVVGIALQFQTVFGRNPGVALLVMLFALKLLELRTVRDGFAVALLSYFLILTQFFYAQSIANAALAVAGVALTGTALIILNHQAQSTRSALRLSGVMLLQSLPFMLVLFVLFPRVQGPLWGLPLDAYGASTGLSDSMTPGSISQLGLSDAIAFRAKFTGVYEGKAPPQTSLYWRGPVLSQFDGRTWRVGRVLVRNQLPYETRGNAVEYSVTLEPHSKPWLFALELPGTIPAEGLIAHDYQLLAKTPVRSRMRYEMRSYPETMAGEDESGSVLRETLLLPAFANPRARALAQSWRAEFGENDQAIVRRMLDYYRSLIFIYTLSPPILGEDSLDEFLFDTKRGFCEHFAAGFVFMMRAAGIPARVVTGYQGGAINPVDGTLIVRQSDAHAWAEIWLKGRGWVRVDPTAAIAPSRIENNLAVALPAGDVRPLLARPEFLWLLHVRYRWDALANIWNQWVLGYNPQRQRDLLTSWGMRSPDWQQMTVVLTILCGTLLLAYSLWAIHQRQRIDPALRAWNRLSKILARQGLARTPWEGPQAYASRVAKTLPPADASYAAEVAEIADIYAQIRYAQYSPPQAMLRELKTRITKLAQFK